MTKIAKLALQAFASIGSFAAPSEPLPDPISTSEGWRQDWQNLYGDMARVIDRDNERHSAAGAGKGDRKHTKRTASTVHFG
jgi:hypothetical protein